MGGGPVGSGDGRQPVQSLKDRWEKRIQTAAKPAAFGGHKVKRVSAQRDNIAARSATGRQSTRQSPSLPSFQNNAVVLGGDAKVVSLLDGDLASNNSNSLTANATSSVGADAGNIVSGPTPLADKSAVAAPKDSNDAPANGRAAVPGNPATAQVNRAPNEPVFNERPQQKDDLSNAQTDAGGAISAGVNAGRGAAENGNKLSTANLAYLEARYPNIDIEKAQRYAEIYETGRVEITERQLDQIGKLSDRNGEFSHVDVNVVALMVELKMQERKKRTSPFAAAQSLLKSAPLVNQKKQHEKVRKQAEQTAGPERGMELAPGRGSPEELIPQNIWNIIRKAVEKLDAARAAVRAKERDDNAPRLSVSSLDNPLIHQDAAELAFSELRQIVLTICVQGDYMSFDDFYDHVRERTARELGVRI
jgi:hypothetical protein